MRELLIFRHAKSRWDEPDTAEHDRALAPRGIDAAGRMGRLIAERGWFPDLILCSTAVRARATLDLAREAWPPAPAIETHYEAELYLAAPRQILEIIRRQPASPRRLLVVGHNPGLQSFVLRLTGQGPAALRRAVEEKLPTAALVRFTLPIGTWPELGWGMAKLENVETPKQQGEGADGRAGD